MNSDYRWPTRLLGEVVDMFVGLPIARYSSKDEKAAVRVPILSVADIDKGQITERDSLSQALLRPHSLDRFRLRASDVVVSARGTQFKSAIVRASAADVVPSSNLIVMRPHSEIAPQLLLALLRLPGWKNELQRRSRASSGALQLTTKDFYSLLVPIPPPSVQGELASLLDGEEEYRAAGQRALDLRSALVERLLELTLSDAGARDAG